MILYTTGHYDAKRMGELHFCLRKNAEVKDIKQIHLFIDCDPKYYADLCLQLPKLTIYLLDHRPTYADLISASERVQDLVLITNGDVYLDDTVSLLNDLDWKDKFMALSRWEIKGGIEVIKDEPHGTQDCWAFLPPLRMLSCSFPFGAPGCDNRIVAMAEEAKYLVFNSYLDVRLRHVHLDANRTNYTAPGVGGPYGWSWLYRIKDGQLKEYIPKENK